METTEKIVESYCRYVKGWFTIPNIKCSGQYEIDLLAIKPLKDGSVERYHIEVSISISGSYSKLTAKEYSPEKVKQRVNQAGQRMTIGFFIEKKFGAKHVSKKLKEFGFKKGNYKKVIVTMGWTDDAKVEADRNDIILWDFREILKELETMLKNNKTYFSDDTLRTLQLFVKK